MKKRKGSVECGTACFSGWCWLGCGWWKKRWKRRRALEFPVVFSLFLDGTTLYEHNGSCVPLPGIPSGSQLSQNIISPARVCLVKIILDSSWRWLKIWHYANHLISLFRGLIGFLQNPIFLNSLKNFRLVCDGR